MKKLSIFTLISCVSLLTLVSSCKKESPLTPVAKYGYDNNDVKSMIKIANKNLYNRIYSSKAPSTTIYITHGLLIDPAFECLDYPPAICSIVIVIDGGHPVDSLAVSTPPEGSTYASSATLSIDNTNYSYTAVKPGDATLILAKQASPVAYDIKSVSIIDVNGKKDISYEIFQ